ncbi:MAG: Na+/H+ antiporter [Siphonobacter aquaeclarae]|jgi:Na+/H+ antiporter|nr:Na+/H+ antiporter [Siphonobacter aquaeclarae]
MAILAGLAALSPRLRVPYPVLLVVGGLLFSFIPGLPDIRLEPDVVFLVFLPPLLYEASWKISWHDLKTYRRPISRLAIGLVFLTTTVVAAVAHYVIPGVSWPVGFVLGAIVSPPDAVAATSATKGLGLPKRASAILEGESLINDASALIAYRYAVAAVASGTFVFWKAGLQFLLVSVGGAAAGVLVGIVFVKAFKKVQGNQMVEASLNILVPFISYLFAEHIRVSGVLSVVATGLYVSWRSSEFFSYQGRILTSHFWELMGFLLNGFVFILIGLQLPVIMDAAPDRSLTRWIGYGLLVSAAAILVRMAWVFLIAHLPFGMSSLTGEPVADRRKMRRELFIEAWAGMRGVVSLATALALPLTLQSGRPFPHRELILFITFVVILVTLVLQGLSLPYFIRRLGVREDPEKIASTERRLRLQMARHSLRFIETELSDNLDEPVVRQLRQRFEQQINYLNGFLPEKKEESDTKNMRKAFKQYLFGELELISAQRSQIVSLLKEEKYPEELIRKIEGELDLWNLQVQSRLTAAK